MKLLSFLVLFNVFVSGTAFAAGCYTSREAEAEQGIRIHSELMVIGLNCAHMADANGNNLYLEHKKFTAKHEDLFVTYEDILIEYMRKSGIKNPEKGLHKLRTEFANKISNDVAEMRPDIFCKTFSSRIEKAAKMDRITLRKWAATPYGDHPVSYPLCEG
ncbi:MAG: hypothetical protein COA45_10185 [Zetaproteobacteria bacterium]|nr:MAG: hypothetical protein COA45_10185 [Zetaproteobacteria bacterium]